MNLFLQRNWHISVRLEDGKLISDAIYCGTDRELNARLTIEPKSLKILNALDGRYTVLHRFRSASQIRQIPKLVGLEAYFDAADLRKAPPFS